MRVGFENLIGSRGTGIGTGAWIWSSFLARCKANGWEGMKRVRKSLSKEGLNSFEKWNDAFGDVS